MTANAAWIAITATAVGGVFGLAARGLGLASSGDESEASGLAKVTATVGSGLGGVFGAIADVGYATLRSLYDEVTVPKPY